MDLKFVLRRKIKRNSEWKAKGAWHSPGKARGKHTGFICLLQARHGTCGISNLV